MKRCVIFIFLTLVICITMAKEDNDYLNVTNCSALGEGHGPKVSMDEVPKIVIPVVFGLILILGVIGNGSVIVIVLKSKQMRTIPNIYLLSLALGDLLLVVCAVPFSAFVFTFPSWIFGEALCKVNYFLETLSLGVSVFTLTLLSIDRYMAICHPMRKRSATSMKKTVFRASAVWIISLILAIPDGISSNVELDTQMCVSYCTPFNSEWGKWYGKFHAMYRFIILFTIPVCIITICYCLMAKTLVSSNSLVLVEAASKRHGSSKTKAGRTQVAKLVLSFVVVFVVCWLPRHVFLIGHHFDLFDFNFAWYIVKILGFCLAFLNSCMNPLALYLQSEQFRKYFIVFFCRCWAYKLTRSGTENTPTTTVTQCHYTKGVNEESSSALLKVYRD